MIDSTGPISFTGGFASGKEKWTAAQPDKTPPTPPTWHRFPQPKKKKKKLVVIHEYIVEKERETAIICTHTHITDIRVRHRVYTMVAPLLSKCGHQRLPFFDTTTTTTTTTSCTLAV